MPLTMSQACLPAFEQTLGALSKILDKAEAHALARKIDPLVLLQARLYPDMFPLTRQVQLACDFPKGAVSRLAGKEVPSFPDTETTFAELKARIAKTLDHVRSFSAADLDGSEARPVTLKVGPSEMSFSGQDYLVGFVLPNLYFHAATAYAILRHNGVEIGKRDFMGLV